MQCPRCSEEVADQSTECPVCRKPFPAGAGAAHFRVALTGEVCGTPEPPTASMESPSLQTQASSLHESLDTPPVPPLRITFSNPALNTARQSVPVLQAPRQGRERRWLIVIFSIVGALVSGWLWYRPYVPPVDVLLPTTGGAFMEPERAIPAVYLWLWGCYGVLAVATQFFLPAPWRFGPMRLRNNWVLNITTLVTVLLFLGTSMVQEGENLLDRRGVIYREDGRYQVQNGAEIREVTAAEAQQINAQILRERDRAVFKLWNMAALLSYLALGGYAGWWLIVRPEDDLPAPSRDAMEWLRQARGENEPSLPPGRSETLPSADARAREPADKDISWR